MAVSIVSSQTISGDTFYKNKDFSVGFSYTSPFAVDASLSLSNSTYAILPYVSGSTFRSTTGVPTSGTLGTLRVDVIDQDPRYVRSVTPASYIGLSGLATSTDTSGTVYVAVANQHSIFTLDPSSGTMTRFAGTGVAGDTDGPRLTAQFRSPTSVAADGSGNVYVTDQFRLRKIDSNGTVSTLAGSTTQDYVDSSGANARFRYPNWCLPRPSGDVFVTDSDNHAIRNVTPNGIVTTYAGGGGQGYSDGPRRPGTTDRVFPSSIRAVGTEIYDTSTNGASWIRNPQSPAYTITTCLSDPSSGLVLYGGANLKYQTTPTSAIMTSSTPLALVNTFATNGTGNYVAGGTYAGYADGGVLYSSNGTTWNVASGDLLRICYVSGYGNGVWLAGGVGASFSSSNLLRSTTGNSWTRTDACPLQVIQGLSYSNGTWVAVGIGTPPVAISTDDGVTWTGVDPGFQFQYTFVAQGAGVCVIGEGAYLYVASAYNLTVWNTTTGDAFTSYISALYYSKKYSLFIAVDQYNQVRTSTDGVEWTAGPAAPSSLNAFTDVSQSFVIQEITTPAATFAFPGGLALDASQTLYVADAYNNRIRAVTDTTVSTYAGTGADAATSGTLASASIGRPIGLARSSNGTFYVTSGERHTLHSLSGNTVSLLAGRWNTTGLVNGRSSNALFWGPGALTVRGSSVYLGEVYNGVVREYKEFPAVSVAQTPNGGTIIATSNYPITMNSRIDVCWTSVAGQLPLYKFEPFSSSLTANRCGGVTNDVLTYSASSTELIGYLSGTGTSTVFFRSSNGPSVAYTYPLTLSVNASSNGTVVDSVSTSVTINPARILYTPCNANLVFYRNEPSPAPVFSLAAADAGLIYSATTLPTGLTFTRTGAQSFALTGTPTIQTIASNYTILAFDTSGRTYSTQVSMTVNAERLLLDVSGPLTQTGVLASDPITPVTFTAQFPPYGSVRSMRYTWTQPPPTGLQFVTPEGIPISGTSYSVTGTSNFPLTLTGTLAQSALQNFAFSDVSSLSITVTGVRTSPTPSLSPSLPRTLTLRFGESIFFTSNVPSRGLFVGGAVSNYFYSAATYFPLQSSLSTITSIDVTDGFLPDGLTGTFNASRQRFELSGTPITAATFPFTLTASNAAGTSGSLSVAPTISNDFITISGPTDTCFNFIQTRSLSAAKPGWYPASIRYSVASGSGYDVSFVGSNLPAGVSLTYTGGVYELTGRPTTATASTVATLTARVAATGVSRDTSFTYSVSAETFFFPDTSLSFIQNVPISPVSFTVTTLSENLVNRFSSSSLPASLQVTNIGTLQGTLLGSNSDTLGITAFTTYASGSNTYSYTVTPDRVLLQPDVYTVVTAPGRTVSIPITGYSLSALTVSNYRFNASFPYGLTVNSTSGLLSGTLASSLPSSTSFTVLGSAGSVNGSLAGTMTTTNLTVNRAQMIGLGAYSNLTMYSSDTNGLTWISAGGYSNTTALTIGTNGSTLYLVPTSSNTILRSSNGASYTPIEFTASSNSPRMTAVVNKPGTSTWWIAGSILSGVDERAVYLYTSTDDGTTWDTGRLVSPLTDRGGNIEPYTDPYQAYLNGGVALAYKDGVLLIGGDRILRSTDEGASWSSVLNGFAQEVGYFSLDQTEVWVATGSDLYQSRSASTYVGATCTIKYSTDKGLSWSNAVGSFTTLGYEVQYGGGVWIASGLQWMGFADATEAQVRYSLDGVNWGLLSAIPGVGYTAPVDGIAPLAIGPIAFDETTWVILRTPDDGTVTRYTHPADTPIPSGWTSTEITSTFSPAPTPETRFTGYVSQVIDPGADVTTITFPPPTTGPVFTSPAQTTYVVWQYMPIPPLTFSATGTNPISYFVSTLPIGLTWNSTTKTVSGACMQTGTQSFAVYGLDGTGGVTRITITFVCSIPRIVKQQSGAGAYTALVRDYTEVAAAIHARDTRVDPTSGAALGSFASPYPPDVVTPSNCPC